MYRPTCALSTMLSTCICILTVRSSVDAADPLFVESGGLCVFEAEAITPGQYWYERTGSYVLKDSYTTAGASSNKCLHFTGNSESSGPVAGIMEYHIKITDPGTYHLRARTMEAPIETGAWDKANDCYIKMVGQSGIDGQFTKFVRHGPSWVWGWDADLETHSSPRFREPIYQFTAGTHVLQVAGRSKNFLIDKIVIFKDGISSSVYQNAPLSSIETDTGTTNPDDSSTTGSTRITGPAETLLVMGQTYLLTAEGSNLSWSYDANSDGLGAVPIGSGDSVSFTVPDGVSSPMELTLTCSGAGGDDTRLYSLTEGTTVVRSLPTTQAIGDEQNGAVQVFGIDGRLISRNNRDLNAMRAETGGHCVHLLRSVSGASAPRVVPVLRN
ncbi:MAG: hypothetical protein GF331_14630 [Chitinivibrionales bacterium]|nr:hypothetical protein [Chitinivibrionales bacterium]